VTELELDILGGDGEKTLKDALHGIMLWRTMDLQEIPWSLHNHLRVCHHYLLTHLLYKNHTIQEKQAVVITMIAAITMMTSLPIDLSNNRP
jgi:hypothetical protein